VTGAFHHLALHTKLLRCSSRVLLGLVLATQVWAQKPLSRSVALYPAASKDSTGRRAAIRNNGRFLGWKFAALSGQDTKRWQRNRRQSQLFPPAVSSQRSARPLGGTPAPGGFADAGFEARSALPAGFIPTAITNGDFNGDGKMDFAISNGGDNTIYVFLGNGDGTFQVPEVLYTQGQSPDWITAVNLRKNGPVDLAVTDGDSSMVEVFLGNGDGTFQPSTQTSLPQIPTFILAADVNNDGDQDLVVGLIVANDANQPQFEVLLGNGSGGFSGTLSSPAISGADGPVPTNWIAVGDLNNDGYVDVVTTISGGIAIPYLSQSGRSFSMGNPFGPNNGPDDAPLVVELGDMNEDGCLDAIETDIYSVVNIAFGTCDGNFPTSSPSTPLGDFDPAVKVVDVNGDGHLDVVGSAVFYPNSGGGGYGTAGGFLVSVLMGDGQGDLGLATVYRGGTSAYSLVVADFSSDGKPDILTADSLENQTSFFLNDGTGNYGNPQGETIGYVGGGPINAPIPQSPMEVADLNGDGKPDLFLVEDGLDAYAPSQLTAMLNDGTGRFLPAVRTPITVDSNIPVPIFIAGAFRTPTAPDVIYMNTYNEGASGFAVAYFRGNGDGTFAAPVTLATLADPLQVIAGDFNNDGKLDFVVVGVTDTDTGPFWQIDTFLGGGNGTFTHLAEQQFPFPTTEDLPQQLIAVDLNHDGNLDLLIGLNANQGWVASGDDLIEALGNGDGTFQTPTTLISHFGAVAVADVNNDGYPDLIQNRDPNGNFGEDGLLYQPGITVYLGSANGTFQQQPSHDLPGLADPSPNPALVGDFNGDGIPDIAVRYWVAQPILLIEPHLIVLQGVGDGTFIVTSNTYQLPGPSNPFVGANFSGDGATDLVDLTGFSSSFTTIPAASAPSIEITLDSSPILGTSGEATVSLDLPATSSQTVTLSASDPAIQLPPSISFTAGEQTQDVSFTLGSGFDTTHVFALYATLGTQTAVAYGTKPNPNLVVGVTAQLSNGITGSPNLGVSVEPGQSFELFLNFQSEGGYSGTFSSLQCRGLPSGASCSFGAPSIPVLPGGGAGISITVSTSSSTPFGSSTVTVSGTDGVLTPAASFNLGIGNFSLSINPTTIVVGPSGVVTATISSTSTYGLNEELSFACTGLPTGAQQCGADSLFYTAGPSTAFGFSYNQLAPSDYPFQITGTADLISHTINATLQVGNYAATLDKTTATLSAGQSATFNLTLTSINHYTSSSITVFCQPLAVTLTCAVSGSPTALTDGGTAVVQLTVNEPSIASGARPRLHSFGPAYLFAALLPLSLLALRKGNKELLPIVLAVGLVAMISCGGGQTSGSTGGGTGGGGGGTGGGGNPQTVSISVVAQAVATATDSNNQQTLPPIVITLN
jgi:hypothetical protein